MKPGLFLLPRTEGETGFLQPGATDMPREPPVVVVPGAEVLFLEARLPPGRRLNLQQAIPNLLEENLLPPMEELHFARGPRRADGVIPVAVVARQRMTDWLARLAKLGIQPRALVCDCQLLPATPGAWTVLAGPEQCLVRPGEAPPFVVETANLAAVLNLALTAYPGQPALTILDAHSDQEWSGLSWPGPVTVTRVADPLTLFDPREIAAGINLLQGEFGRRERWLGYWQRVRLTVALLVVWGLLGMTLDLVRYHQQERLHQQVDNQIRNLFATLFPGSKPVKPRLQMEQKLRERANQNPEEGFLPQLQALNQQLAEANDLTLERIHFQNNALVAELRAAGQEELAAFRQRLSGSRMVLENVVQQEDGVTARLRVGP